MNSQKSRKVALFFGSFNPVHKGHLNLAEFACRTGNFDEVWMVVSPESPFKSKDILLPAKIRLKMLKISLKEIQKNLKKSWFRKLGQSKNLSAKRAVRLLASNVEFRFKPPHYTYRTLLFLKKKNIDPTLLMGEDTFLTFWIWQNAREIVTLVKDIWVFPRKKSLESDRTKEKNWWREGGFLKEDKVLLKKVKSIATPLQVETSTEIRDILIKKFRKKEKWNTEEEKILKEILEEKGWIFLKKWLSKQKNFMRFKK